MKEKIKANKVVIILVLMVLMAVVVTARSSGDCGEACGGAICPIDTQAQDVSEMDSSGAVYVDTFGGTKSKVEMR